MSEFPKLKEIETKGESCSGCYFEDSGFCENILCEADERSDGKNVIFVED